jgi:hypothetical protein
MRTNITGFVMELWHGKKAHDKEHAILNNRHVISAGPAVNLKTDRGNDVR